MYRQYKYIVLPAGQMMNDSKCSANYLQCKHITYAKEKLQSYMHVCERFLPAMKQNVNEMKPCCTFLGTSCTENGSTVFKGSKFQ